MEGITPAGIAGVMVGTTDGHVIQHLVMAGGIPGAIMVGTIHITTAEAGGITTLILTTPGIITEEIAGTDEMVGVAVPER